jgi:hypothetical protein
MPRKSKPIPRIYIREQLSEISPYEFEGDILRVQETLNEYITRYGPTVKIEWDSDNWEPYAESASPVYRIILEREENDIELAARLDKIAAEEAAQHARELAEYNRLKLKLEGRK